MPDHRKPTSEELEQGVQEAIVAAETPEAPEEVEETPVIDTSEEKQTEEIAEEVTTDEEVEQVAEEEAPTTEERYKESSKEARKLAEDQRKINDAFHEAHNLPEPTEDELKHEFPDWELMSDTEKRLATKTYVSDRRFDVLEKAAEERRVVDEWNDKVSDYIDNPKTLLSNPDLEGKRAAFLQYAMDKGKRNINFGILVSAFLHDHTASQVKHKGTMFETGQGGDKAKVTPKDDSISLEEAQQLMSTNYSKYKQMLVAGKIRNE